MIESYFKGKKVCWHWLEGEYAGAKYENTFHTDGTITWLGIEGGEKGLTDTESAYQEFLITEDIYMLSWHESNGTTVTVTLNIKNNTIYGIVCDGESWVPLKGVIEEIGAEL